MIIVAFPTVTDRALTLRILIIETTQVRSETEMPGEMFHFPEEDPLRQTYVRRETTSPISIRRYVE